VLSKNAEDGVGIIFSFSLCTAPIWVVLVVYFGRELGKLRELRLLGGGEILLLTLEINASFSVIRRECRQTLARVRVSRT